LSFYPPSAGNYFGWKTKGLKAAALPWNGKRLLDTFCLKSIAKSIADYHFDSFAKIFETTRMALEPTCFFAYYLVSWFFVKTLTRLHTLSPILSSRKKYEKETLVAKS
jgi:hypothetical protein